MSVAGARSHTIVLLSRLDGLDPAVGERLLRPGAPLFEYWGHEASWIPLALYPAFEFRRREFRRHPWWGDLVGEHPKVAADLLRQRIRDEGPLRSSEMEGRRSTGWWDLSVAKRVAAALWSSGELAIRERRNFQRTYDLAERVIPEPLRRRPLSTADGLEVLLLAALDGHGWATTGTLAATWRLRNRKAEIVAALRRLQEKGAVLACTLEPESGSARPGWIRPADRELAARLESGAAARRPRHPALALRPAAVGSRARRAPVRLRRGAGDLQARAAARVRLLLPAGARRASVSWRASTSRPSASGAGLQRRSRPTTRRRAPAVCEA